MGVASAGGLAGGAGLGLLVAALLAPATGGLSLSAAGLGMGVGGAIGGSAGAAVDANQSAQKTKGQQNALLTQQQQQATALQNQLLQTPKTISPDNFLATKASQLAKLRLGLSSTITGTGGVPSAVLSSPTLQPGGQGNQKLGA